MKHITQHATSLEKIYIGYFIAVCVCMYSAFSLVWPLLRFLLLDNVFSYKTVIMEAFVLKLGEYVGTSFIFSLANFRISSLNAYVVITTKLQAIV